MSQIIVLNERFYQHNGWWYKSTIKYIGKVFRIVMRRNVSNSNCLAYVEVFSNDDWHKIVTSNIVFLPIKDIDHAKKVLNEVDKQKFVSSRNILLEEVRQLYDAVML